MHPDDPSASAGTWPATAVLVEAQRREIGVGHRPPVEVRHGGQRPGPLSHAALQHVPCSPVATVQAAGDADHTTPRGAIPNATTQRDEIVAKVEGVSTNFTAVCGKRHGGCRINIGYKKYIDNT